MITSKENTIGAWAFLVGVILSVVIGLATTLIPIPVISDYSAQIYGILVLLGLLVGFMNVSGKESQTFLIAGAIVVIVSGFGMDAVRGSLIGIGIGDVVTSIFAALLSLFVPAPIIVALNGVCAGLGMSIALLCDMRFASENGKFVTAFSQRGLVAEHGQSWILPRLIGPARALDLLWSSRRFSSDAAKDCGRVERIFPHYE